MTMGFPKKKKDQVTHHSDTYIVGKKTHLLKIYHMSYGPPSLEPCCLATAAPSRCLWLGAVAGRRGAAASAAALASSTAARWAAVARRCARLAHQV